METVQLAVTVAVTLIDELAVPASAAPGKTRPAARIAAPVAKALERGLVSISNRLHSDENRAGKPASPRIGGVVNEIPSPECG